MNELFYSKTAAKLNGKNFEPQPIKHFPYETHKTLIRPRLQHPGYWMHQHAQPE